MPSGIGFELVFVAVLLAILVVTLVVVRLRVTEATEEPGSGEAQDDETSSGLPDQVDRDVTADEVARLLRDNTQLALAGRPSVFTVIGTNRSETTTVVGMLAHRLVHKGRLVALAAPDTSSTGTHELATWADRAGADVIAREGTSDPGSALYEAVEAARAGDYDVLIVASPVDNTDGMDALATTRRILEKAAGRVDEVLFVLDLRTGQDGIIQAKPFIDAGDVTGIALTGHDSNRDPRIVLSVREQLGVPLKLVATGEALGDLRAFDVDWVVQRLPRGNVAGTIASSAGLPPGVSEGPSSAAGS